jgi:hypothetical protein
MIQRIYRTHSATHIQCYLSLSYKYLTHLYSDGGYGGVWFTLIVLMQRTETYDYNYLHQQMHNYFFIKHTPRLHISEQARTTHHRQRITGQHFK